jgi:hypothetical protein
MNHDFSKVPHADIQRSTFNRSHGHKTTFNSGKLIPILVDEVLPGDTFNVKMDGFARLATPIAPIMDNLHLETFFFFVPNRLVWDNWQKFNGEQDKPGDTTDFLVPTIQAPDTTGFAPESTYDYMGIPTQVPNFSINALHNRAINLIWNEWFRDENLQDSLQVPTGDGPDDHTLYESLLPRGKRHDYFTSCLPWPQKGNEVSLPLGTNAPIYHNNPNANATAVDLQRGIDGPLRSLGSGSTFVDVTTTVGSETNQLFADLTNATASTINQLREAFQIQRLLERDARGGTRYTEIVKSHFGVTSPDARLQRPEYLGGGYAPININPVAQTSATDATTSPQGNLAAFGTSAPRSHGFTKSFTEHGVIIGFVATRADLTYQQGLNRMFSRQIRWDYYWPTLAHLGEQAVLNKEIYTDGTAADDDVFGYQERYAEYRYKPSMITGAFRSNHGQTLDSWHLSQDFGSRPALNTTFIEENVPIDRVVAVPTQPDFIMDMYFDMKCTRPMPTYSVPGLIDHF